MRLRLAILSVLFCATTSTQESTFHELEQHIIYHNVFNSTMILPEVAKAHQLVRAKNQVYLNLAVVSKKGGYGIPAAIKGSYKNLMLSLNITFSPV